VTSKTPGSVQSSGQPSVQSNSRGPIVVPAPAPSSAQKFEPTNYGSMENAQIVRESWGASQSSLNNNSNYSALRTETNNNVGRSANKIPSFGETAPIPSKISPPATPQFTVPDFDQGPPPSRNSLQDGMPPPQ